MIRAFFSKKRERDDDDDVQDDDTTNTTTATTTPARTRAKPRKKVQRKASNVSASGVKYTPLERQVMAIKRAHPDALLMVECGYRFRFFSNDAEIASRVLGIVAYAKNNFMNASVPRERLHVHCGRLVNAGYKVGVVTQTETAALKKQGANKSGPFERELTALYTRATYIGAGVDSLDSSSPLGRSTQYIMALDERSVGVTQRNTTLSVVVVQPATGEVIYDHFDDDALRAALATRLEHLQPCELLLPADAERLSVQTAKLLESYSRTPACTRVEHVDSAHYVANEARQVVAAFYASDNDDDDDDDDDNNNNNNDDDDDNDEKERSNRIVANVLQLPDAVLICFAVILQHLRAFNLQSVLKLSCNIAPFAERTHLALSATTLRNLELLRNSTTNTVQGSLFEFLDYTSTAFGKRLLERWVRQPLTEARAIAARLDAVQQLSESRGTGGALNVLRESLIKNARSRTRHLPSLLSQVYTERVLRGAEIIRWNYSRSSLSRR